VASSKDTQANSVTDEAASRRDEIPTDLKAYDRSWVFSLFGTAVGAGILFLPLNAGIGGFWPLLIVTLLIPGMTYFSHRALSRFVCLSPGYADDITVVAAQYFGKIPGWIITILYFLAIYPIVLIYGVSITNTVNSFFVNQMGWPEVPRTILSAILIAAMMAVLLWGERLMLIVTGWMVYPLLACLLGVSIYLIPSWDFRGLMEIGDNSPSSIIYSVFIIIPVMVFAFNHSPAISQFSVAMQRAHGSRSTEHASRVLFWTMILLVVFTMFFVWSCVLALGPDGMAEAKEQNLPVLSYLANVHGNPLISYLGPLVAFAAIVSSFFGHYLGAAEGAAGLVRASAPQFVEKVGMKAVNTGVAVFMFVTTWIAAIMNPSILSIIESLSGPVIASILYLMPMIAVYTVDVFKPYRKHASNIFVIVTGLIAISGIFLGLVHLFS